MNEPSAPDTRSTDARPTVEEARTALLRMTVRLMRGERSPPMVSDAIDAFENAARAESAAALQEARDEARVAREDSEYNRSAASIANATIAGLREQVMVYRARAEAAEADLDANTRELAALSSDKQTLMTAVTHWREQVEGLRAALIEFAEWCEVPGVAQRDFNILAGRLRRAAAPGDGAPRHLMRETACTTAGHVFLFVDIIQPPIGAHCDCGATVFPEEQRVWEAGDGAPPPDAPTCNVVVYDRGERPCGRKIRPDGTACTAGHPFTPAPPDARTNGGQ